MWDYLGAEFRRPKPEELCRIHRVETVGVRADSTAPREQQQDMNSGRDSEIHQGEKA